MAANGILIGLGLLTGVAVGPLAVLILPLILVAIQLLGGGLRVASLIVLSACAVSGVLRGALIPDPSEIIPLHQSAAAVGVVESLPVAGGTYKRAVVRVERLQADDEKWRDASGLVLVYFPEKGPGVSRGDQVHLLWEASPVNHLAPGYSRFVRAQGASGSAFVWAYSVQEEGPAWLDSLSALRRQIAASVSSVLKGDTGAITSGIITGDDSALSESASDTFRKTGTAHITAVSGQNIALLVALLALWMRPGRRSMRLLIHGAMILAVWMYAVMVGLEPPALRAAVVASLTMAGSWFGRRPDPLTILALTLGGMAFVYPRLVESVGFWLSAAASWALCSSMTTEQSPGIRGAVVNSIKGVTVANIATLPIIMWTFGEWSPVRPVANLLLGPVMTVTFPTTYALAVVSLAAPSVAPWLAWIPGIGLHLTLTIVDQLAPIMPLIQMPVHRSSTAILIAMPCFAVIALISRDGARWSGILTWRWRSEPLPLTVIASGVVCGGMMAVLARAIVW